MSEECYVLGIGATSVGRHVDRSFTDLAREALDEAFEDAGSLNRNVITHCWFGNVLMDYWGQRACRGQETLAPLVAAGQFPSGVATINVEAACTTASVAFHEARKHVASGEGEIALALGVEKMNPADAPTSAMLAWMEGATAGINGDMYWEPYKKLAAELGTTFATGEGRSVAMDIYAIWTQWHMSLYGTTREQIASAAAKNHTNAVDNPRAQYRFAMTTEEVLEDRVVADPLTRAMCAPVGDAGAAAIVCSKTFLQRQSPEVQRRALRIRGHAMAGGSPDAGFNGPRSPVRAAQGAYEMAGIGPTDLDFVELHDATSFGEILSVEDLGLCERGEGGPFTQSGSSARDGRIPVNPSGGLVSRGHPLGATGILMLNEISLQLRGEAGDIQIPDARIGLAENGGGIVGHDKAVCAVTILEASA